MRGFFPPLTAGHPGNKGRICSFFAFSPSSSGDEDGAQERENAREPRNARNGPRASPAYRPGSAVAHPGDQFDRIYRTLALRGDCGPGDPDALVAARMTLAREGNAHRFERRIVKAREHAEVAVRAKSEFIAALGRDIRASLDGVLGLVDLLLQSRLAPTQRRHLEWLQGSARTRLATPAGQPAQARPCKLLVENCPASTASSRRERCARWMPRAPRARPSSQ